MNSLVKKLGITVIIISFIFVQIFVFSFFSDFFHGSVNQKVTENNFNLTLSIFFIYNSLMNLAFLLLLINQFIQIRELKKEIKEKKNFEK